MSQHMMGKLRVEDHTCNASDFTSKLRPELSCLHGTISRVKYHIEVAKEELSLVQDTSAAEKRKTNSEEGRQRETQSQITYAFLAATS